MAVLGSFCFTFLLKGDVFYISIFVLSACAVGAFFAHWLARYLANIFKIILTHVVAMFLAKMMELKQ